MSKEGSCLPVPGVYFDVSACQPSSHHSQLPLSPLLGWEMERAGAAHVSLERAEGSSGEPARRLVLQLFRNGGGFSFHPCPISSIHPLLCSCPSLSRDSPPSRLHALLPSPSLPPVVLHGEEPKLTSTNSKLLVASHTSRTTQTTRDDTKSQETKSRRKRLLVQKCALRRGTNPAKPALA